MDELAVLERELKHNYFTPSGVFLRSGPIQLPRMVYVAKSSILEEPLERWSILTSRWWCLFAAFGLALLVPIGGSLLPVKKGGFIVLIFGSVQPLVESLGYLLSLLTRLIRGDNAQQDV